ncbi:MAG: DNA-binding protein [Candidatus Omnitrophota bacterium]
MKRIDKNDPSYPANLSILTGKESLQTLHAIGDISILRNPLSALFCSVRCPAEIILKTYDLIRDLRDSGVIFIGGFHSPIEKDCLEILLRGCQPIVICPAKSIDKMRIPGNWAPLIDNGRLLILSPFVPRQKHITSERAQYRNLFVAALAKEIYIFHAANGSKTRDLFRQVLTWGKPVHTFNHPVNGNLIDAGAQAIG